MVPTRHATVVQLEAPQTMRYHWRAPEVEPHCTIEALADDRTIGHVVASGLLCHPSSVSGGDTVSVCVGSPGAASRV